MAEGYGTMKKTLYGCNICKTETEIPEGIQGFTVTAGEGVIATPSPEADLHICFPCLEDLQAILFNPSK